MNAFLKLLARREVWALLAFMLGLSFGSQVQAYKLSVWFVLLVFFIGLGVFLGVLFSEGIKARTGFFTGDE